MNIVFIRIKISVEQYSQSGGDALDPLLPKTDGRLQEEERCHLANVWLSFYVRQRQIDYTPSFPSSSVPLVYRCLSNLLSSYLYILLLFGPLLCSFFIPSLLLYRCLSIFSLLPPLSLKMYLLLSSPILSSPRMYLKYKLV